jgi:hypothetical protein
MVNQVKTDENAEEIIIVSGLPRSGTSMMMNILDSAGIPALVDEIRKPDTNNPKGYWEFEAVKNLPNGEYDWLDQAKGKCIKVISFLLTYLPNDYFYKVVFLERNLKEIQASQLKMLSQIKEGAETQNEEKMAIIFQKHLENTKKLLHEKKQFDTQFINYNSLLYSPITELEKLNQFLNGRLNTSSVFGVIDTSLYRNRFTEES